MLVFELGLIAQDNFPEVEPPSTPFESAHDLGLGARMAIRKAIGSRSFVGIGVGEGAATEQSARLALIRFLHEEEGFDVIVDETDLFKAHEVDKWLSPKSADKGFQRELISWMRSRRSLGASIRFAGYGYSGVPTDPQAFAPWFVGAALPALRKQTPAIVVLDAFAREVDENPDIYRKRWGQEYIWRRQAIEDARLTLRYMAELVGGRAPNLRHSSNVFWLAKVAFPTSKIIILGSNKGLTPFSRQEESMGTHLRQRLAMDFYSICTANAEQRRGDFGERPSFLDLRVLENDHWRRFVSSLGERLEPGEMFKRENPHDGVLFVHVPRS